jgi:hypothetical protein
MATTQIKPVASGAYTNVVLAVTGNCGKSTTGVSALPPGQQHQLCRAVNMFHNTSGTGTSSVQAQKVAAAQGQLLRWA